MGLLVVLVPIWRSGYNLTLKVTPGTLRGPAAP